MKIRLVLFFLLGIIFMSTPSFGLSKSLWIWNRDDLSKKIESSPEMQQQFFSFLKSPHGVGQPFDTIYLDAKLCFKKSCATLSSIISAAHERGIKVYYSDGDPSWALFYQDKALKRVRDVIEYNHGCGQGQQFDGIIYDIEPYLSVKISPADNKKLEKREAHLMPEWILNRDKVEKNYLKLLADIKKELEGENLPFGVAMPLLFAQKNGSHKTLSERTLEIVDFAVLMDYRDMALRIIREGKPVLDQAQKLQKKVLLAVETLDLEGLGEGLNASTFAEEGFLAMEKELAVVRQAFRDHPGFGGISIHDFKAYQMLQKHDRNKVITTPLIKSPSLKTPVVIDGDLSDWDLSSPVLINKKENVIYRAFRPWRGIYDLSGKVYTAWDRNYFYLAVEVLDDKLVTPQREKATDIWRDDHLELWFAPHDDFSVGLKRNFQLGISPGNFKESAPLAVSFVPEYLSAQEVQKIELASKRKSRGYLIEAAIPVGIMDQFLPKRGKMIRFSVELSDTDDIKEKQEILMSASKRIFGKPKTFLRLKFE